MALENLFFKHEFNSRNDPKLLKIKRKLKMEGIGIYWCLIEILYERNGYLRPEELEDICYFEHIDTEKAKEVMKLAEFKKSENGYYLSGVIKRIEKREEYSMKQRTKANKRWKKEAPTPDWYEDYENEKEKKNEQEKEEENVKKKAADKIHKKYPEYMELIAKSLQEKTTPEEEKKLNKIKQEEEQAIKKEMDKVKKNSFFEG